MSNGTAESRKLDLGQAAILIALAIGMVGAAMLLYYLIDILLIFFLGLVVAAALQPWHVRLCNVGVPRGIAVLLIYLLFVIALALIAFFVGPVLIEQISTFAASFPEQYTNTIASLQASPTPFLRSVGAKLPSFAVLTRNLTEISPSFFGHFIGFMGSTAAFFTYFVVVLVFGFYWTLEVPRFERLLMSLLPVARRTQVLNIWHEIEFKLGAFIRGQGLAMLAIGIASAIGYALIGLPNVLVLAVLAGLFEAVPMMGPALAAVPAIFAALPLGPASVLLVIGYSILLQMLETNVLTPRIMSHTVGMSALIGLFAILAFGALYGVLGVFIAIPLTVVLQVLLDHMVINAEPVAETTGLTASPLETLRTRVQMLRRQMRLRLREGDSRMGIDPQVPEHVADAVHQQIEQAVDRVETMITVAQDTTASVDPKQQVTIVEGLEQATQEVEQAAERVETIMTAVQDTTKSNGPTIEMPLDELHQATQQVTEAMGQVETVVTAAQNTAGPLAPEERVTMVEELDQATQQIKQAVGQVDTLVTAAQDGTEASGTTIEMSVGGLQQATQQVEQAVERVETIMTVAQQDTPESVTPEERVTIVTELQQATQQITQAVHAIEVMITAAQEGLASSNPEVQAAVVEELQQAAWQVEQAAQHVEALMTEARTTMETNTAGAQAPSRKDLHPVA
ncbi:MAG: AI-2E family transporter [Candidatus Binatia bacterium]